MPVIQPDKTDWFLNLKIRLQNELPGSYAHEPLRAVPLAQQNLSFKFEGEPRPGAVLILLCGDTSNLWFPLIKRTESGGVHSGQISFPGGRTETGESPEMTALREAQEEIGINPLHVEVLGNLTMFHVIPSHFLVTPVVARWIGPDEPVFNPDPVEVDSVFRAPLHEFMPTDSIIKSEIDVRGYRINAPHFLLNGRKVWGATAMMLNELRVVLHEL